MYITKRNANLSDAAVLLKWRNSPSARKFSQNSELIQIEDHLVWLSERLERITFEPFYMFELGDQLVGMSRLDFESQSTNEFVISILVDPVQHGKGFGKKILNMTCANIFDSYPSSTIVAKVHQDNSISQKLFVNCGFKLQIRIGEFLRFERTLLE
jgi:UDP-2,4-diacetamido-2,4,6-trideoxy-beta-L-altropyranose hydrolase